MALRRSDLVLIGTAIFMHAVVFDASLLSACLIYPFFVAMGLVLEDMNR